MAAFVSTAALLAWATPPVSASVLFYWLFNPDGGLVDWTLSKMPHWLVGSTDWAGFNWTTTGALQAYTVLTILVVWQSFPFIAVTVLAGLKTVPAELYEAARVDGANAWRLFWRITYPLLKPIFLVLLLLSVIWDFNVFTQTYLLTGGLGNRDEFNLSLYIYDKAFTVPAELRPRRRARADLHADPADRHRRLRPRVGPPGSADMSMRRSAPGPRRKPRTFSLNGTGRAGRRRHPVPDLLDGLHGVQAVPGDLLPDPAPGPGPSDARQLPPR